MKKVQYLFVYFALIILCPVLQGCVGQLVRSGLDAAVDPIGLKDIIVPLNQNPRLEDTEKSLLSTVPPLKICLMNFEDKRNIKQNRVGETFMTNFTGVSLPTKSIWHYVIAKNQSSVDLLITEAIVNELKRNGHTVTRNSEEQGMCDYVISGDVDQFWITRMELVREEDRIKGNYTHQVIIKIAVYVQRKNDIKTLCCRKFRIHYASKWDSSRGIIDLFVGQSLDEALIEMLKLLTNDEKFIKMLSEG